MSFHVRKHQLTSGKTTYRIRYHSKGKHKTLSPDMHPQFKTEQEALNFCTVQNAKADAEKHLLKHAKGMDEIEWKKQFANLSKEVGGYLDWYKKKSPNSWEANRSWLDNYVLPYFVERRLNNPNLWYTDFEKFKDYLEHEAETMNGRKLSFSSMGHIIKALNSYLAYLGAYNKMDILISKVKCDNPFRARAVQRGKEALILEAEYEVLRTTLGTSREFLIVLMNTGMRFMELYSLQFTGVEKGGDGIVPALKRPFEKLGLTIHGYIRLESQAKKKFAIRDPKTGKIERKPLKSKKKISVENNRYIPITDSETWDILLKNRRRAFKEHEARIHTSDEHDDYLLMNVDKSEFKRDLAKHTKKTSHCCRHSYVTNLVRAFREVDYGPDLIKGISGHTSSEFTRYVHLTFEVEAADKKKKVVNF